MNDMTHYSQILNNLKNRAGGMTRKNYMSFGSFSTGSENIATRAGSAVSTVTGKIMAIPYIKYTSIPLGIFIILVLWRPNFLYTGEDEKRKFVPLRAFILSICITTIMAITYYAYNTNKNKI